MAPPFPSKAVLWLVAVPFLTPLSHDSRVEGTAARTHTQNDDYSSIAAQAMQCTMQVVASAGECTPTQQAQAGGLLAAKRLGVPGTLDFSKRPRRQQLLPIS